MGFLSKAWKGIKKFVKKSARTIKKFAKKLAYAIPGGKQLWKLGGKIGTKILKGVGKVVNKLGPVGMIALSVLAPYAAPLWHAFGAAATASTSIFGTIGQAVYTAGNWVGGTLGSMTKGISDAIGTVAEGGVKGLFEGSLSKASEQAVNGFAKAFTGEAGKAGVQRGVEMATQSALEQAAGNSVFDQVKNKIVGDVGGQVGTDATTNKINENINNLMKSPEELMADTKAGLEKAMDFSYDPQPGQLGGDIMSVDQIAQDTLSGKMHNQALASGTVGAQSESLLSKAGKVAKGLLSGAPEQQEGFAAPMIGDVGSGQLQGGLSSAAGGLGSGGGQFLSQQMLAAMQQQQERMQRGF